MPKSPEITIITPMFNCGHVIDDAMASVAAQTFDDWEHILIDDGSRDDSLALARRRAETDPRLRVIANARQQGALEARNIGLDAARGRYIAFLDADDFWLPTKIAAQVAFMESESVAISHTGYRRFYPDQGRLGRVIHPPARLGYWDLLRNTAIVMSSAMVDRRGVGDLRVPAGGHPSLRSDLRFWLQCTRSGAVARGLQDDLVRYRVVAGSLSSNPWRSAYWVWRTYRDIERLPSATAGRAFLGYGWRAAKKRLG